jgi:hypothetical protein
MTEKTNETFWKGDWILSSITKMTDKKSEFGQGLTYCLGLFLAHEWNLKEMEKSYTKAGLNDWAFIWFNGASDHLYDLEIPDKLPKKLKTRLLKLQKDALDCGHGAGIMGERKVTKEDALRCLKEAKSLLMEIDKWIGVDVIEGVYE